MKLFEFAPQYIRAIHPYQPGKPISELVRDLGLDKNDVIKLASNENPLGTSPLALEAMSTALSEIARKCIVCAESKCNVYTSGI